jgi:hypothetical protein
VHFASYALVSERFFTCAEWDGSESCGWASVERFANRAWRRPLEDEERERLQAFWQANWSAGTPDEAIVLTVAGVLQSPQFLYRIERGDPRGTRRGKRALTDFEVASRLSYFLWDTMPDAELFRAATEGELGDVEGVRSQVQRMLADPKAEDAVVRFHSQWLGLEDLQTISPARSAYGPALGVDADPPLDTTGDEEWPTTLAPIRHSMEAEFHYFVRDAVFSGPGTLEHLLTSNQGWASGRTRGLYGAVEDRAGDSVSWPYAYIAASGLIRGNLSLQPITFPEDERGGVLTLPGVLAINAYAVHPAPVLRGKTVLERVMCTELGAPPPGAEGAAPPDIPEAESTNRLRTENATSPAECAPCHDLINPPGFAFENYDALGLYRSQDNGEAVDASGDFSAYGETFSFSDGVELGQNLASSPLVKDCYTLHWARYATGEDLDPDDERLLGLQEGFREDDSIPRLLEAIAVSDLFRYLHVEAE